MKILRKNAASTSYNNGMQLLHLVLLVGCCHGFTSPVCERSILNGSSNRHFRLHNRLLVGRSIILFSQVGELETDVQEVDEDDVNKSLPRRRGKVNEIDFCMAPSDISLSGGGTYTLSSQSQNTAATDQIEPKQILSLTRALNSASNRALRRILLSRAWPSPEALNRSLRQVLAAEKARSTPSDDSTADETAETGPKCPIPRPVLDILMGRQNKKNIIETKTSKQGRTDQEWVADQILTFSQAYGDLPGYPLAEAYLESILSLATSGVESSKVTEVLAGGVYSESYRRFINVLKSVGVQLVEILDSDPPLSKIAPDLSDFDICLSIIDKINMKKEQNMKQDESPAVSDDNRPPPIPDNELSFVARNVTILEEPEENSEKVKPKKRNRLLNFLKKEKQEESNEIDQNSKPRKSSDAVESIDDTDLGGVLLSSKEPTMTRHLNALSNIVKRALLFGGDQELLVLFETLEADRNAFIQRWYPGSSNDINVLDETRPGVQYFNNLVQLLKNCYNERVVSVLEPPLPLNPSFSNSYERLVASLIELGSGYINPWSLNKILEVLPKTPTEELGRFAKWETSLRKSKPDTSSYPDDFVGKWQVEDEVGGKTIGVSIVEFAPEGEVSAAAPIQGLRWRLDPGPTHLDTCTFQVLSADGTILQYRGFLDRGARLESRFSKRSIKIRGAVTFQMRDGEALLMGDDYRKDMLPVSAMSATTRFIMKRV